jgi:hypothetical protein
MDLAGGAAHGSADGPPTNSLLIASVASAGAGVLHAAASGAHSDHAALARIFLVLAIAQAAAAVAGFLRPGKLAAAALVAVNAGGAAGWLLTRFTGLSDVSGLEVAQQPGVADTAAAILALVAALAALLTWFELAPTNPRRGLASASVVVAALVVPGMLDVTTHGHDEPAAGAHVDHGDAAAVHAHDEPAAIAGTGEAAALADTPSEDASDAATDGGDHVAGAADGHDHASSGSEPGTNAPPTSAPAAEPEPTWPWPWNPAQPIDFSGVPGVTPDQEARAEQLVADTMRDLPAFSDVASLEQLGYKSIGDSRTGFEHYINFAMLGDDKVLDPTAPESLVYQVDDPADPTARTLVSAMYIAQATSLDDPAIADFAGPLMQWHNHTNLCWRANEAGDFVVAGVTDDNGGTCPEGTVHTGGQFPMVHVWIAPHECGPFAALEGHGAGQAGQLSEGERVDLCGNHHGHADTPAGDQSPEPDPVPYDPAKPIDLGGIAGVSPEQQAFAENLVADTVRNLPQWADPAVAEAAGFHSILDGSTGHEHYIQWDWINDDVWLDPDFPESLVYEPQLDGTKTLVSAMYMLPNDMELADVPDWGGSLMQWHEHGDLCFTDDPVAPRVAGTKPIGEPCQPPLVDGGVAPMIHVWITPHVCGPFAALEGIGAGQVQPGEEHLCDEAHGAH